MDNKQRLTLGLELLWWVLTLVLLGGVLYPVRQEVPNYPFYRDNIIFIVAAVTLTRYIFLLRHTFLARQQVLKIVVALAMIPLVFFMVQQFNYFQTYMDNYGLDSLLLHLPQARVEAVAGYIRSQMLFFGTCAVIAGVVLPLRLIASVWLLRNRGLV